MALDKDSLKSAIQAILEDIPDGPGEPPTAESKAEAMADAIHDYVKAAIATVTIPPGTVVNVPGGPTAVGLLNVAPIPLTGDPDDGTGGLS